MTSSLMLSALAAAAAILVVASPQDPSFDYPGAKHIGFDQARQAPEPAARQDQGRLSMSFSDATVGQVLDWLKSKGVDFVVSDEQVDKDSHISINLNNQPLAAVMDALGRAWNGRFERQGDIWVFRKGSLEMFSTKAAFPEMAPAPARVLTVPGVPAGSKEEQELWRKSFDKMNDPKHWAEIEKHMAEIEKNGKVFRYELKAGQRGLTLDGKDLKPLDEKQIKAMQAQGLAMAKQAEAMAKQSKLTDEQAKQFEKRAVEMAKAGRDFTFVVPDMKPLTELQIKALGAKDRADMGFARVWQSGPSAVAIGGHGLSSRNLKAVYDLMTPTQTEKMNRLGYINYSDLNSKQRAILGVITDDNWTISYKTDKVNITIKSDR